MGKETVPFDPWHGWWHSAPFVTSMVAGGVAGLTVDVVLFPIDALKTRLQAPGGLRGAGGFSHLYRGIGAAALGSVPCSALFFTTYEGVKARAERAGYGGGWAVCAMAAAAGEIVACSVRTPAEVLKQRMQVGQHRRLRDAVRSLRAGGLRGIVGFRATAARDVPFSMLQYPMYECAKVRLQRHNQQRKGAVREPLPAWQAALVGAATGTVSAFITTPLDVCKTRCMLRRDGRSDGRVLAELRAVADTEGVRGLFRGASARATWMGLGGLLFLGSYEKAKAVLEWHPAGSDCRGVWEEAIDREAAIA